MTHHILNQLYDIILERKNGDPEHSYVASLFAKGTPKIAQKIGEEATETIIGALQKDRDNLKNEAADLLFHLLILLADQSITPDDVFEILQSRTGQSGLTEKKNRS